MKKTSITLLSASIACLLMGVGGALATSYVHASKTNQGSVDSAIYLYWGSSKETTANIEPITTLTSTNPVYRYVACESVASSSLTGKVKVDFTISGVVDEPNEKTYSLEGLTVEVYKTTTLQDDSTRNLTPPNAELLFTLDYDVEENRTNNNKFDVASGTGSAYYCMKFMYDDSPAAAGHEWGGEMTLSQTYVAE